MKKRKELPLYYSPALPDFYFLLLFLGPQKWLMKFNFSIVLFTQIFQDPFFIFFVLHKRKKEGDTHLAPWKMKREVLWLRRKSDKMKQESRKEEAVTIDVWRFKMNCGWELFSRISWNRFLPFWLYQLACHRMIVRCLYFCLDINFLIKFGC